MNEVRVSPSSPSSRSTKQVYDSDVCEEGRSCTVIRVVRVAFWPDEAVEDISCTRGRYPNVTYDHMHGILFSLSGPSIVDDGLPVIGVKGEHDICPSFCLSSFPFHSQRKSTLVHSPEGAEYPVQDPA